VLKRELLFDPGIDLVCSRLPCAFVRRGALDPAQEIEEVCKLAEDMGPNECLTIFPEGTRFSPEKRERLILRLREKGQEEALARATALRRTLPLRPGGPLALLQRNPHLDLVICTHVGFEGAAGWAEVGRGELAHKALKIRFWRFPAADIPRDPVAAEAWISEQWLAADRWIEQNG
jgi:1-acyl-sn-glycerol-3-phosphate acyltransferase